MITSMTKKELASIAGYTYRRLYDIDRDLPKNKKLFVAGEDGKYDLALFVQRWVDYNRAAMEQETEDLDIVKAQHEAVKMRKTQLEVSRLEGEYVPVREVEQLWANIAAVVRGRFVSLPRKLAPALVMIESPDRIEEIIDRDVRDALNMIADTPLPGAPGDAQPDNDEDDDA